MAKEYNLKDPKPIMCSTRQFGNALSLESQGKYYIWGQIEDAVYLMDGPTTEDNVMQAITMKGVQGLQLRML